MHMHVNNFGDAAVWKFLHTHMDLEVYIYTGEDRFTHLTQCLYLHVCMYTYTCIYMHIYVCMHMYMYICMFVYVDFYMCK